MTRGIRLLGQAALVTSALAGGCAASFTDPRVPAGEESSEWVPFYLWGSVGHAEIDVRDHCPTARAHRVRTGGNVLTIGATLITVGIYAPRKVTITCEAVPSAGKGKR